MLPNPIAFLAMPTRIANAVHYLSHGKTINPILINPDEFDRLQQWIQKSLSKKSHAKWSKVK